jgi:hypothetical protein
VVRKNVAVCHDGGVEEEDQASPGSRAVLIVAAVAVLALVVATIVAIVFRSPTDIMPGTPEATAQDYANALIEGDEAAAIGLLSADLQEECTIGDLRNAYVPESVRVHLVETVVDGEAAEVEMRVEEGGGGLGDGYDYRVTLTMERQAGDWVITEPPWPIEYCAEVSR